MVTVHATLPPIDLSPEAHVLPVLFSLAVHAAPAPWAEGCTLEGTGATREIWCPTFQITVYEGAQQPPRLMVNTQADGWIAALPVSPLPAAPIEIPGAEATRSVLVQTPQGQIYALFAGRRRSESTRVVFCASVASDEAEGAKRCTTPTTWVLEHGAPTGLEQVTSDIPSLTARLGDFSIPDSCQVQRSEQTLAAQCATGELELMIVLPGFATAAFEEKAVQDIIPIVSKAYGLSPSPLKSGVACEVRDQESACHHWQAHGPLGTTRIASGPLPGEAGDSVFVCVWTGDRLPEACSVFLTRAPE